MEGKLSVAIVYTFVGLRKSFAVLQSHWLKCCCTRMVANRP